MDMSRSSHGHRARGRPGGPRPQRDGPAAGTRATALTRLGVPGIAVPAWPIARRVRRRRPGPLAWSAGGAATAGRRRARSAPVRGRDRDRRPVLPARRQRRHRRAAYNIHDRYRFGDQRCAARPRSRCARPRTCRGFDLDFLLPVSVTVDGEEARFDQTDGGHELRRSRRRSRWPPGSWSTSWSSTPATPARYAYARRAQLAGQRPRGRRDERAAHGAVVVPRQRPPAATRRLIDIRITRPARQAR